MRSAILWLTAVCLLGTATSSRAQTEVKPPEQKKSSEEVNGKTLVEWMKELRNPDPSAREQAIAVLKVFGHAARPAVRDILKAMEDPDVSLRVNAIITLGFIGMEPADLERGVTALTARLQDQQGIVRFQAVRTLGNLGVDAIKALPIIAHHNLQDRTTWEIRGAAANALGNIGWDKAGADPGVTRALIGALGDRAMEVRLQALYSLITLGIPRNRPELNLELQTLNSLTSSHQPERVAIWAHVGIMRITEVSQQHLIAIDKFLKSSDARTREHAARALTTVGYVPKSPSVEPLIEVLGDKDPRVLFWVCAALAEQHEQAEKALPGLQKLTEHENPTVKAAATKAIEMVKQRQKKQ
jgi:HEAT repeat protein